MGVKHRKWQKESNLAEKNVIFFVQPFRLFFNWNWGFAEALNEPK